MNQPESTPPQRKTLSELATEIAAGLGITTTGSCEIHCRDGKAKVVKVTKTIVLENEG
jgi:hypothetical protein